MSLILEALRKSEADRRRVQAPDLFAEPIPMKTQAAATSPRWLAWTLAAVVALLLAGWVARGLLERPPQTVAAESAPGRAGVAPLPQASSVESPYSGDTRGSQASARAPRPVAVQPAATVAPPRPTAVPPAASELPSATVDVRPASAASPEAIDNPVAASPPELPPATISASSMPSTEALRLADLSSEERRQLPTLKMSMHLWHAVSAQRFVILDGERMGEGDRIGDAVIDEITRDGVLLAWQGRRLKLPIQ